MRVWYLSHYRAMKAQASLRKCADSPEHSLLVYIKFICRLRLRPNFRTPTPLDTSAWTFKEGLCASCDNEQNTCSIKLLKKKTKTGFQDQLSLNAVQKYCSILQYFRPSLSYIVPVVIKTFVLSIFEWPFYTGFTVYFVDDLKKNRFI